VTSGDQTTPIFGNPDKGKGLRVVLFSVSEDRIFVFLLIWRPPTRLMHMQVFGSWSPPLSTQPCICRVLTKESDPFQYII